MPMQVRVLARFILRISILWRLPSFPLWWIFARYADSWTTIFDFRRAAQDGQSRLLIAKALFRWHLLNDGLLFDEHPAVLLVLAYETAYIISTAVQQQF